MKYQLVVYGEPFAQKRHKYRTRGRGEKPLPFVQNYDPSEKDKDNFSKIVQDERPPKPLAGAIRLHIRCYFAYRKGDYRSGQYAGQLKPNAPKHKDTGKDWDNCGKFYSDALTGIFFLNDSQVADGSVKKYYSENPRVEIDIENL